MMKTDDNHYVKKMSESKINEIKKILDDKNFPKYPKVDKVGVFVGNLPYTYTEKEIGDLFGEYGITNIALVRDNDGLSKGFAFVEVSILP
jgi:RNA recognition motif-containing protein